MDIKYLAPISAIIILFLALMIVKQGGKNPLNRSFAVFSLFVAIWSVCLFFYEFPIFLSDKVWIKIVYLVSFSLAPSLFYFCNIFAQRPAKSARTPLIIYTVLILPLIYSLFFTNLFVKDVFHHQTILGPVYPFMGLVGGGYFLWAFVVLIKKYLKTKGILQTQIQYFILGIFLFAIGAIAVDIVIPLMGGGTSLFWLSPVFSFFLISSTSYAITRYRLMDVRIIVGKGMVYLFSFASVIAFSLLASFLNSKLLQPLPINAAVSLVLIIGIIIFQPIFKFFEKFASKYFYYTLYSYQTVLADLGKRMTQVLDLDRLSSSIIDALINTIKLDRAVILLREPEGGDYRIQQNIGFKEENGISLIKDNFLTVYLEKTQKPLVYEELSLAVKDAQKQEEKKRLETLQENIKKIEAALCLPLFFEEKIIGMIVLGNKISGDAYSQQDIELLVNLSNQASIALQNARLYNQVQDFSQNLQEKVDTQTKELKKAYDELKKIDTAKSEFISMASHQLRTPLTAIKGYASMILDGTYGKLPAATAKPLNNILNSNERLIKLVNDLLNISKIELGKIELNISSCQIEETIQSCYEELKGEVKKKGLKFIWQKPGIPLPEIKIDELKIRQVILNLIDNAIRYTKKGEIEIKAEKSDSKIKIFVRDTGEGLNEGEQDKLFKSFVRGSAGINLFIEGTGLGLYIAKKLLDLHNGRIWAESKGKDNGSTFYIELPIT